MLNPRMRHPWMTGTAVLTKIVNQQRYVNEKCGRCGECIYFNHHCKAVNRRCYRCGLYGHYADYCRSSKHRSYPAQSKCKRNNEDLAQISKTNKETPSVCQIMPFSSANDEELKKLLSSNSSSDKELCSIKRENSDLKQVNRSLTEQIKTMQMELDILKSKVDSNLKEDIPTTNQNSEIAKLKELLEEEQKVSSELVDNSYEMFKRSQEDVKNLSTYVSGLLLFTCDSWQERSLLRTQPFDCQKCGSSIYHKAEQCPADKAENTCGHCGTKGHFSVFCKTLTFT